MEIGTKNGGGPVNFTVVPQGTQGWGVQSMSWAPLLHSTSCHLDGTTNGPDHSHAGEIIPVRIGKPLTDVRFGSLADI
jgi:hypothetical protein